MIADWSLVDQWDGTRGRRSGEREEQWHKRPGTKRPVKEGRRLIASGARTCHASVVDVV
jgi:hypothetical protein